MIGIIFRKNLVIVFLVCRLCLTDKYYLFLRPGLNRYNFPVYQHGYTYWQTDFLRSLTHYRISITKHYKTFSLLCHVYIYQRWCISVSVLYNHELFFCICYILEIIPILWLLLEQNKFILLIYFLIQCVTLRQHHIFVIYRNIEMKFKKYLTKILNSANYKSINRTNS